MDWQGLVFTVVIVLVVLLFTGPGLWSERWGWGPLKKLFPEDRDRPR